MVAVTIYPVRAGKRAVRLSVMPMVMIYYKIGPVYLRFVIVQLMVPVGQ